MSDSVSVHGSRATGPRPFVLAFALALGLSTALACSSPSSFVVLGLEHPSNSGAIAGVTSVAVKVTQGATTMKELTYRADGFVIDAIAPSGDAGASSPDGGSVKTLSVECSGGVTGVVTFEVSAIDDMRGCVVGHGRADVPIRKGGVVEWDVVLTPVLVCGGDGGVDGGVDGGFATACDPQNPSTGAAALCASGQICEINCRDNRTDCVPGGTGAPGSVCQSNADCAPGSQCFDYAGTGCMVKVCLRFCGNTSDCAAFGAGGGGSGSLCEGPVQCGGTLTPYHTCTFNCDPTAAAAATHGGCAGELVCVMPASMDAVDCACPEVTRTGTEGQPCSSAADCAPGLICNLMNGARLCRPICRCDAHNGACNTHGPCPTAGTSCQPVTNDTLFGVCL